MGNMLIGLAFVAALVACWFYYESMRGRVATLHYGRWATLAVGVLTTVSGIYLMALILGDQFQYEYVASYSSRTLPLIYKVSAFWAGQEGSFLLWLIMGAAFALALIVFFRRDGPDSYEPYVMLVMNVLLLFPMIMLMLQQPFRTLFDVPADGQGLSPLLQDPYMAIHPPILFVGFAGLAIPYAYAIAALWRKEYTTWIGRSWWWTLFSWGFLGLGLALGGFWAYRVLGWGGYWGWDPVENSSLVPWITGCALIHGMITQTSRGRFVRANILLAALTYAAVIYSTFLTRSGVLTDFSVHTFGESPLAPHMLAAVLLTTAAPLALFVARFRTMSVRNDDIRSVLSRDFTSLAALVTLVFAAVAISVGTSSPILTGIVAENGLLCGGGSGILLSLGGFGASLCQQSSVAQGYYSSISIPIGLGLAIILSISPILAWQMSRSRHVAKMLKRPFVVSVTLAAFAAAVMVRDLLPLVILFFSLFALATNFAMIMRILYANWWKIGGYLAHAGLALALVGIIGTTAYKEIELLTITQGQAVPAMGYTFQFQGLEQVSDNRWAMQILVRRGNEMFLAQPKLVPTHDNEVVRNPYIHKYLMEDLYISPGDYDPGSEPGSVLEIKKGESQDVEEYSFKFIDYVRTGHDTQQSGVVSVGAIIEVTKGGTTTIITPTVTSDPQKGLVSTPATVPGTKIDVSLDQPQTGSAVIHVVNQDNVTAATPPSITVEVIRQPGINLLWAGLIAIFVGTLVAVLRRYWESRRGVLLEKKAAEVAVKASPTMKRRRRSPQAADPARPK